eukprot:jgi/Botrbrau1/21405/Bobra.0216s0024.1
MFTDELLGTLLGRLHSCMGLILQLLKMVRAKEVQVEDDILLALCRPLGRYMKEVPPALSSEVLDLLPFLLSIRKGAILPFLAPFPVLSLQ